MSQAQQYAELKHRIELLEAQYPDLVVIAEQANSLAISGMAAGRMPQSAPLVRVTYKAGSDEIWLQLATGYSWKASSVAWKASLMNVCVYPNRPRGDHAKVVFLEVDH